MGAENGEEEDGGGKRRRRKEDGGGAVCINRPSLSLRRCCIYFIFPRRHSLLPPRSFLHPLHTNPPPSPPIWFQWFVARPLSFLTFSYWQCTASLLSLLDGRPPPCALA